MKKWIIILLCLLALVIAGVYIFIPSELSIKKEMIVGANPQGVYRTLSNEDNWIKWLPGKKKETSRQERRDTPFNYNGYGFHVNKRTPHALEILLSNSDSILSSALLILPLNVDSSGLKWKASIITGSNPFKKIRGYFQAKKIAGNMGDVLTAMKLFLSEKQNIYDICVYQRKVKDTMLISVRETFMRYPSTAEIYVMIGKLRNYIIEQNGRETNDPMLHIEMADSNRFEAMVAIPVDRSLPEQKNFYVKRMLYQGNILEAEVMGGTEDVKKAHVQFQHYISDYRRTSPFLPFEMLVTDRSKEPDTSKWITKIFYPVY